jgi:RHS repeat-associated protein
VSAAAGGVQVAIARWAGRGLVAGVVTAALGAVMLTPVTPSAAASEAKAAAEVLAWARENAAGAAGAPAEPEPQAGPAPAADRPEQDAPADVWATGEVIPESGGQVAGEGVVVEFSGHDLPAPVDVAVTALDETTAASAAGADTVVLAPGFDVSAVNAGGEQVTSFPNETTGAAEPAAPGATAAAARRSAEATAGPDGGPLTADGRPLGSVPHPEGANFDVDDSANSVAGDDGADTVAGVHVEVEVDRDALEGIRPGSVRLMTRETDADAWQMVPSYLDVERSVVVGELDHLSQFVVIGGKDVGDPRPRVVLDPDNDKGYATGPGPYVSEVGYNVALANAVAARLTQTCNADVVVTRPTPIPDLDQTIRAGMAYAHNPDLTLTIGFNSTTGGAPWGNIGNGGSEIYARGGPLDQQARATMLGILPVYTTRPANPESRTSPLLPYDDYQGLPGAMLHLETLYLNHNFDRVIIDQAFSFVVDGVFTSLGVQLTNQGYNCLDPDPGGGWPEPPSAAQVAAWMQLGFKNYAAYGGDPVNFATGNLVELEDLFHVTGPGGSDTQVALVYNSQDGRVSRFGTGWTSDLTARAQRFTDGSVMVVRGDGASFTFTPDGAGGYTADVNTGATLAEAGGGHLLLTVDDGTTWRFDASHPEGVGDVVEKRDPTGAVTRFEYAPLSGDPMFRSLTAVVLPGEQRIAVASDARGMVTALAAPDGRTWQLGYDAALDLRSITLPDGRVRSFDYDTAHRLTTARDGAGAVYLTNVYDDAGRVVAQGDGVGGTRTFTYRPGGVDYTDAAGSVWSYEVDARSRVTRVTDPLGEVTAYEYGALDAPTAVTTPGEGQVSYGLDGKGRATAAEGPAGEVGLVRDDLGRVTQVTEPAPGGETGEVTTTLERDAAGRVTQVTGPDGAVEVTEYDGAGNSVRFVDAAGAAWTATFDTRGNQTTATDPLGRTSRFTYDAGNRLTSETAPSGATTTFAYDTAGRLASETDPLGGVTTYGYDANDHVSSVMDPAGAVTRQEWDTAGRLVAVTDPTGGVTRYGYDPEDTLTSETDPTGATVTYTLDAAHRTIAVTDPNGGTWQRDLDGAGRVIEQVDPAGGISTWEYDEAGNLIAHTDPDGVTDGYVYSPNGDLLEVRDSSGASTSFTYDVVGRVVAENGPDGTTVAYVHDVLGQLVATTDQAGNTSRSEFDAAGQLVTQTDRTGAVTTFEYDADGNQTATVDPDGVRQTYTVDAAGRVTASGVEGGASWEFGYDPAGRVVSETDATGAVTTYAYDPAGRTTQVTDATGAVTGYGYDAAGRQTSRTDADDIITTFAYDRAGQLTSVVANATGTGEQSATENVATAYEYTPTGQLMHVTLPTGGTTTYEYTPGGRVTSESDPLGSTWAYAYDETGRLSREVDPDDRTVAYTYDAAGRVSRVGYTQPDTGDIAVELEYDAVGNMIAMSDPTGVTGWTYDAEGRQNAQRTRAGTLSTAYTPAGRQITRTTPDGITSTWAYDAAGRVAEQGTPAGVMAYTYDLADRVTGIERTNTDATNGPLSTFAYDPVGRTTQVRHQVTQVDPLTPPVPGEVVTECDVCLPGADYLAGRTLPGTGTTGSGVWDIQIDQTYTPTGHAAARTRVDAGGRTLAGEYTYDPLGRLTGGTEATHVPGEETAPGEQDLTGGDRGEEAAATTTEPAPDGSSPGSAIVLEYTYDAAGNRVTAATTGPDGVTRTQTGTYDEANRLTTTSTTTSTPDPTTVPSALVTAGAGAGQGEVTRYGYDRSGNRTTATSTPTGGNLLSAGASAVQYAYGPDGRLASVTDADRAVQFTRDGLGRTVDTTTTTDFVEHTATSTWDGYAAVATDDDVFGTTTYTRDATGAIAVQSAARTATTHATSGVGNNDPTTLPGGVTSGATWELTDALGSVIAQAAGDRITQTATYDPWGVADLSQTAGWDADHGYTAQTGDTGLGLTFFYARTYDPTTGTFTTLDPWDGLLTEPETLNTYAYVLNDPLTTIDVLGYWPGWLENVNWREVGGVVAGVAAGIAVGVAVSACIAATAGICAGVAAGVATAVIGGAAAGAAGAAASYAVTGNNGQYSWGGLGTQVMTGTVLGAGTGGVGFGLTAAFRNLGNRLTTAHTLAARPAQASTPSIGRASGARAQPRNVAGLRGGGSSNRALPSLPRISPRLAGHGSTGRTLPRNLREQLAMTQARANPGLGRMLNTTMGDARWPAGLGWRKYSINVNGVEIHYVRNIVTRAVDDFKFVR